MNTEPIHIISLGAGVQSSTMALMAAHGELTPMPNAAVFADTQAEPASVYRWLDWLEKQLPFPVHRVSKGSLLETSLKMRTRKDGKGQWVKSLIPAFIKNANGTRGIMGRACTFDYKVMQLEGMSAKIVGTAKMKAWRNKHTFALSELRAYEMHKALAKKEGLLPPQYPRRAWKECQDDPLVIQWIGISLDEAQRMKPSRKPWIVHRWPLVDLGMKRHDCLRWMEKRAIPKPPRSACICCPFHSDAEWRRMRDKEPVEFAKAVQFEKDLQKVKAETDNLRGVPFLHNSLKPLGEVDLSTDIERGQGEMFGNDCTGLCGV